MLFLPLAAAVHASTFNGAPRAGAGAAGLGDGEETLGHPNLAGATTLGARLDLGARFGAAAGAHRAILEPRDLDVFLGTERCLFEGDLEVKAQIGAPCGSRAATALASEKVAE